MAEDEPDHNCERCKTAQATWQVAKQKGYRRVCHGCLLGAERRRISRNPRLLNGQEALPANTGVLAA